MIFRTRPRVSDETKLRLNRKKISNAKNLSKRSRVPRTSNESVHSTRKLKPTFSSSSTFVPPNSGKRTWSPIFTDNGTVSPFSFRFPGPQATTLPSRTLPIDFSGNIIPPLVLVSAAIRSISTRSNRGLKRFKVAWKILS